MDKCEYCGKNKKRFRIAFGSWICDNCKKETHVDASAYSFEVRSANSWWINLKNDEKISFWKSNK